MLNTDVDQSSIEKNAGSHDNSLLERLFKLKQHGTTVKMEALAGCTTFITMCYVVFVVPEMLSAAGMDRGALFVATCLISAISCIAMGLYANWPVGLAPGMGLNAFFAYAVVLGMGYSWEQAMGAVFWGVSALCC